VKVPPVMGLVRAFNFLLGVVVVRGFKINAEPWAFAVVVAPVFGYVTCLTYVSTLEDGPVDRRKVVVGAVGMSVCALLAACMSPVAEAVWGESLSKFHLFPALIPAWALVGWLGRRAWRAKERKDVMLLVRDGVAGIILVDAAMVLSFNEVVKGLMVAGLLIPAIFCLFLFKKLA
jgi:hypothetical protein